MPMVSWRLGDSVPMDDVWFSDAEVGETATLRPIRCTGFAARRRSAENRLLCQCLWRYPN